MTEKVGGIEYEVGMDVNAALKGGKALNSELNKLEKTSATTDKKVKALNDRLNEGKRQFTIYANETEKARKKLDELKASSDGSAKATERIEKAQVQYEKTLARSISAGNRLNRVNESVREGLGKGTGGMKEFGRKAGMAGVQFEQLIGSINAGQNPMRAFGFQAADLGIVLGAPLLGAIAGISASLLSVLVPSLLGSGNAVEDFKFDIDDLKESIDDLGSLTKAQLLVGMLDTNKAMDEMGKQAAESGKEIARLNKILDNAAEGTTILDQFGKKTSVSVKLTKERTKELNDELLREQANLDSVNQEMVKQSTLQVAISSQLQSINDGKRTSLNIDREANEATSELNNTLAAQITALLAGEEATFRYATAQSLGLTSVQKLTDETDAYITALFNVKRALKEAAEADKNKEQSVRREQQIIDKLDQQIAQRQMTKTEYQEFLLMQQLGIENEGQMTDAVRTRLELLRSLNAEQGTFNEGFLAQMEALRESADNVGYSLGKAFGGNVTSAVDNLSSGIADAVMNQESLGDAVKETARAFLRDMVASLIKVAAQKAIGYAIEAAGLATVTAASATAGATAATAWAPAAALSSLASFGANAIPAAAGIASTVALSQGLALTGARYNGGNVAGGSMYRVGENNKPELLQSGNDQYLIPGSNGKVISNNEMTGSGGSIQVTVNNYGEPAEVQVQQNGNFVTIDMLPRAVTGIMQNDFANRGKARKTLENTSNLSNRTT